jgi:hypothetical protein
MTAPKSKNAKKAKNAEAHPQAGPTGKLATMIELLGRPEGATIEQLVGATGWLSHSVRGAMAGSLKKKHGLAIISAKEGGVRVYRTSSGGGE